MCFPCPLACRGCPDRCHGWSARSAAVIACPSERATGRRRVSPCVMCSLIYFVHDALARASNVTNAGFRAAAEALGSMSGPAATLASSPDPRLRHEGARAYQLNALPHSGSCFKYVLGGRPLLRYSPNAGHQLSRSADAGRRAVLSARLGSRGGVMLASASLHAVACQRSWMAICWQQGPAGPQPGLEWALTCTIASGLSGRGGS
jgi:hypothetical protein